MYHPQTLLTPVFWMIPLTWILVFIAESIYILFSFLDKFSYINIVKEGIGFQFFLVNCCQISWIVAFCFDHMMIATISIVLCLLFLCWLNFNLYFHAHINKTPRFSDDERMSLPQSRPTVNDNDEGDSEQFNVIYEWLLFRLPFQLHLAWVIFVAILNLNQLAVALQWSFVPLISLGSVILLWIIGKKQELFDSNKAIIVSSSVLSYVCPSIHNQQVFLCYFIRNIPCLSYQSLYLGPQGAFGLIKIIHPKC